MQTYEVIFRAAARDEALKAAEYIAEHGSMENSAKWLSELEVVLDSLATAPRRCAYARENERFPNTELRQLIHYSHRIIFTIRDNAVHILHVRHTARDTMRDDPTSSG